MWMVPERPWRLSLLILLVVAAIDALDGEAPDSHWSPHCGPLLRNVHGSVGSGSTSGGFGCHLAVLSAIPDGIWGTATQFAFACAVLMVGVAYTWAASIIEMATKNKGGQG